MDIKIGTVARAKAGRDKGGYFIVTDIKEGFAFICNGKSRPLDRQKKKKLIHLEPTATIITEQLNSDRQVRRILREFTEK